MASVTNPVIPRTEEIRFMPYITMSGILHGGLIVLIALSAYFHWNGNRWAGPGGGSSRPVSGSQRRRPPLEGEATSGDVAARRHGVGSCGTYYYRFF